MHDDAEKAPLPKMAFSLLCLLFLFAFSTNAQKANRSFTIDYDRNTFVKDGEPFRYIAGTLHYFQIPRELWRDRMLRVRALGCNALQTYVMWSRHEAIENRFDFAGDQDLNEYLSLAKELGFVVVLRAGPFIDAEMDFGGLPYWLLKKKMTIRSSDPEYMNSVEKYMNVLLPNYVKPHLYSNGGPVILVQIENEYGSYPVCDRKYMERLRDLFWTHLGRETVLITTDEASKEALTCGSVKDVLPTTAFGPVSQKMINDSFAVLRTFLPKGPLVCSEFYPGWTDKWGNAKHATALTEDVLNAMKSVWSLNWTSFTIYPAHGGTNWGYDAGSEAQPQFQGFTTDYDFDAPISEAGDITQKFLAMRQLIEELTDRKIQDPIPDNSKKYSYGKFRMEWMGTVFDLLHSLTDPKRIIKSEYPLTMEKLDQPYGFVVYETTIPNLDGHIEVRGVRDRAYVVVKNRLIDVIQRGINDSGSSFFQLSNSENPVKLQILVENQGRIAYGPGINDPKGLLENVTLNGQILKNWVNYPIDISMVHKLDTVKTQYFMRHRFGKKPIDQGDRYLPSIYYGYFFAEPQIGDTFFDSSFWGKGQLFVNGRNIGRYWPQVGPQITLYVPGGYLTQSDPVQFNTVHVLELDQPGLCETDEKFGCWASFTDRPKY